MTQLLENTYNAYEQFLEGSINEYDLMSLIEDEIISGEVLESLLVESSLDDEDYSEELEEGFVKDTISGLKGMYYAKKFQKGLGQAHVDLYKRANIDDKRAISKGVYDNIMSARKNMANTIKNYRKASRNFGVNTKDANENIKEMLPNYKEKLGSSHTDLLYKRYNRKF